MKQINRSQRIVVSVLLGTALLFAAAPAKLQAVSEGTIQLGNVIGNAITTVVRGLVSGQVKSVGDALKLAAYGGASGYGFYQAKNLVAKGNIAAGVALANLSASVCENVSMASTLWPISATPSASPASASPPRWPKNPPPSLISISPPATSSAPSWPSNTPTA